jgi:glycine oxidase
MNILKGMTLAIAGGGVVGLTLAVRAAWSGADVIVYAPSAPSSPSASMVAAGMLAPAFEAALDPASAAHFPLFRYARDLWPDLIARLGLPAADLDRRGALWVDIDSDEGRALDIAARLTATGAQSEMLSASEVIALSPQLSPQICGGVYTPDDWRIDPSALLAALERALAAAGGRRVDAKLAVDGRGVWRVDGASVEADSLVIAVGDGWGGFIDIAPSLKVLSPIKGQLVRIEGPPLDSPVLRTRGGYLAPGAHGVVAGATMEAGRSDLTCDLGVAQTFVDLATRLVPGLAWADREARVGVRAATPDGLPLVGRSGRPDIRLAIGLRRNGWLLAPLVADMILADLAGEPPLPHAARLRADRFDQT